MSISTTEPVFIENSDIRGRGHLIATTVAHVKVIVRNTRGVGINPGVAGQTPGRFFAGDDCDRVTIEHCDLQDTAGIYFLGYGGAFGPEETFTIRFNRASNIDGRKSDGHGGFMDFNRRHLLKGGEWEKGFVEVQFVQFDKVRHVPGIDIGWNQIINKPGNSRVEDNVSIYLSSGTPRSPIRIHDNLICGVYTIEPARHSGQDADYRHDWSYSGGGIMLGDGTAAAPKDATAHVEAFGNVIISTTNYGIAISAGHDLTFHDNRIISCGALPTGQKIAEQNVGAYIWDSHKDGSKTPPTFYKNVGHDNWIGWMKGEHRNDAWHPNSAAWTANHAIAEPITRETEEAEMSLWKKRVQDSGFAIGFSSQK